MQVAEKLGGGSRSSSSGGGGSKSGSSKEYAILLNTQEFEEKVPRVFCNFLLHLTENDNAGAAKQRRMASSIHGPMVWTLSET